MSTCSGVRERLEIHRPEVLSYVDSGNGVCLSPERVRVNAMAMHQLAAGKLPHPGVNCGPCSPPGFVLLPSPQGPSSPSRFDLAFISPPTVMQYVRKDPFEKERVRLVDDLKVDIAAGRFFKAKCNYLSLPEDIAMSLSTHVAGVVSCLGAGDVIKAEKIAVSLVKQSLARSDNRHKSMIFKLASLVCVHIGDFKIASTLISKAQQSYNDFECRVIRLLVDALRGEPFDSVLIQLDLLGVHNEACEDNNGTFICKAFLLHKEWEYGRTIALCNSVLESVLHPSYVGWYCNLVKIHCCFDNYKPDMLQALQVCELALIAYPDSGEFLLLKGNILFAMNCDSEAVQAYEKALIYEPSNWDIMLCLAQTKHRQGNYHEASQYYKAVKDNRPLDLLAHNGYHDAVNVIPLKQPYYRRKLVLPILI